jgi:HNH endonuclease
MTGRERERQFWTRVHKIPDGCWEWTGVRHRGPYGPTYGVLPFNGKKLVAHKFLWTQILGREVPKGKCLHHKCGNKACINPEHLELLTFEEHRGRHPRYILTPAEQLQVMKWVRSGEKTVVEVAKLLDLSYGTVYRLAWNKRYA